LITAELKRRGWAVNHKRVRRIMREDNLLCLRKRKFVATTDSNHGFRVYPNLAGSMELTGLDQLWRADITYIRLETEFVYLAVVLDAFSRRVIGWALDRSLEDDLAIEALQMAFRRRTPAAGLTHHSDRGVQYASNDYTGLLTIKLGQVWPTIASRCERLRISAPSHRKLTYCENSDARGRGQTLPLSGLEARTPQGHPIP